MAESILICRHNKNGTGYCECLGEYCIEGPCTAEELIEYAPVRHGRWVKWAVDIPERPYHCSSCGWSNHHIPDSVMVLLERCPHCGALMDKEE